MTLPNLEAVARFAAETANEFLAGPDVAITIAVKSNSILLVWSNFPTSNGLQLGTTGRSFVPIAGEIRTTGYSGVALWLMINPPSGTHHLFSSNFPRGIALVEHWSLADQTTPFGSFVTQDGYVSGLQSLAVPSAVGAIASALISGQDGAIAFNDATIVDAAMNAQSPFHMVTGHKAGGASVGFTYTGPLGCMGGVSINPGNGLLPSTRLGIVQTPKFIETARTSALPLTVEIRDQYGFVVESDTSPVTVSMQTLSGWSELLGTLTVNAVKGVATFPDLSADFFDRSIWTLTVQCGSLTPAVSAPIKGYLLGPDVNIIIS